MNKTILGTCLVISGYFVTFLLWFGGAKWLVVPEYVQIGLFLSSVAAVLIGAYILVFTRKDYFDEYVERRLKEDKQRRVEMDEQRKEMFDT